MSEDTTPKPDTLNESALGNFPHPSKLDSVPENILAFRTIVALLSQIPQKHQPPQLAPVIHRREIEQQLKISDAFARVLVMHPGVIALATKRTPDGHVHVVAVSSNGEPPARAIGDSAIPTSETQGGLWGCCERTYNYFGSKTTKTTILT